MKFKAVLFDIDGTLVDLKIVVESIQHVSRNWGLKQPSKKDIYEKMVGYTLTQAVKNFYHFEDSEAEKFDDEYHEHYKKHHVPNLLPHAKQVLQELKDKRIKIGIITTKSKATAVQTIKDLNIPHDIIITADDVEEVKPSAEPLLKACKKLKIKPSEALMVGDHVFDVMAAKNAGCVSAAVSTGASSKENLEKAKPDFIFRDLKKLTEIIE